MDNLYYLLSFLNPYAYYTINRLDEDIKPNPEDVSKEKEKDIVYTDDPYFVKAYYNKPNAPAYFYVISESLLQNQIRLLRKINK